MICYCVGMTSGIYQIKNKLNGKVYVGRSGNIERRFYIHKRMLNGGRHFNPHLQFAWDKYGFDEFEFSVLEMIEDGLLLSEREEHYFALTNSLNRETGYNIAADSTAPMLGRKHSVISKEKMKNSKLGKKNVFFGRKHSIETKQKISAQKRGVSLSDEHKEKIPKYKGGEENINAKLTSREALEIRRKGEKYKHGLYTQLAKKYNVSRSTIARILKNQIWRKNE